MGSCCGNKDKDGKLYCSAEETTTTTTTKKFGSAACEMPRGAMRYVGERYITKFADPIEWDSTRAYEQIEAVQHEGFTYISKCPVPAGVQIDNDDFWLLWADPNAQMEQLRQIVESYDGRITDVEDEVAQFRTSNRQSLKGAIVGHRGVNGSAPGNTEISYNLAGKWGYTHVECDVQRTLDGVYVCHHGINMSEDTAQNAVINETNFATLVQIPYTKGANIEHFENVHLLTFEDYLKTCGKYGMTPVIELKTETLTDESYVEEIMEIVRENGFYKTACFISFGSNLCLWARKYNPYAVVLFVGREMAATTPKWCVDNDIDGLSLRASDITESIADTVHNNGLIIGCWYTVEPGRAEAAYSMGVDFLTVDDCCEIMRPSSEVTGIYNIGRGAYVNGVPTASTHEENCAREGCFTNYIYRNPLVPDSNGDYSLVARSGRNLKYCGTLPKIATVGTKIRFKRNPYYQYSVQVSTLAGASFNDSGWLIPENGDIDVILPLRANADKNKVIYAITCATNGLADTYNSEYMFDDAYKYVEVFDHADIVFSATTGNRPDQIYQPQLNRMRTITKYPYKNTDIFPLAITLSETMDISLNYYDNGVYVGTSGWLTEESPGYDAVNKTYTIQNTTGNQFMFVWREKNNSNLTINNCSEAIAMLKFNLVGITD